MTTTQPLNKKQQELIELHRLSPNFDLEKALAEFASKPRGPKPKPPVEVTDTEDSIRREGRFLLEHLENRNVPFVRKTCRGCDRDFLVSYKSCAYCSDSCRAAGYYETYGFIWNPDNTEANRWEFWKVPPSTIRPETLRRLEAFARSILGIEPTEEDLAIPTPTIENPSVRRDGLEMDGRNDRENAPKTSRTSSKNDGKDVHSVHHGTDKDLSDTISTVVAPPAPITGERLDRVKEIKAQFARGLITAHELQVQLATALRG